MATVTVLAGPGVVARVGEAVFWAETTDTSPRGPLAEVLAGLSTRADRPPVELADRVLTVLGSDRSGSLPAFAFVVPDGPGLLAVVAGWGRVVTRGGVLTEPGRVHRVDGGWPAAVGRADLTVLAASDSVFDLAGGLVPGGAALVQDRTGVVLAVRPGSATAEPAVKPEPVSESSSAAAFEPRAEPKPEPIRLASVAAPASAPAPGAGAGPAPGAPTPAPSAPAPAALAPRPTLLSVTRAQSPAPSAPAPAVPTPAVPALPVSTPSAPTPPAAAPSAPGAGEPAVQGTGSDGELEDVIPLRGAGHLAVVRPPLPLAGEEPADGQPHPAAAAADALSDRVVKVPGVRCSRQHFNNPSALYCRVCGISMLQQTHVQVTDVRPPLGVVVVDHGATFSLDADYAVGAQPDTDGRVADGLARPLQLGSSNGSLEPVHLLLTAEGWDVVVENAARQAPVAVWHRGMPQWEQLAPGSRAILKPGSHVALGDRRLVFESNTRA